PAGWRWAFGGSVRRYTRGRLAASGQRVSASSKDCLFRRKPDIARHGTWAGPRFFALACPAAFSLSSGPARPQQRIGLDNAPAMEKDPDDLPVLAAGECCGTRTMNHATQRITINFVRTIPQRLCRCTTALRDPSDLVSLSQG